MDIIFNGPIKRYIRCGRAASLYSYLQTWRLKLYMSEPGKPRPPYDPPKPDIVDGLNYVSAAMESFKGEKFRAAVKRVFQAVGLAPSSNGKYKQYMSHASCKVLLKDFSEVEVINGSVTGLELLIPDVDVLDADVDVDVLDSDGHTENDDEEMEINADSPVAADTAGTEPAVTETSATDATGTNIVSASTPDVVVTNTADDVTVVTVTAGGSTGSADAAGVSAPSDLALPFTVTSIRRTCHTLSSCSARDMPVNTQSPEFSEFVNCVVNTVKSSGLGGCLIEQLHFGMHQHLHQSLKGLLQEDHFIALLQAAVAAKSVLECNLIFTSP